MKHRVTQMSQLFMKKISPLLLLLVFLNCTTVYNVRIRTIPPADYDIIFDKKAYGVMPPSGDTTIRFPEMSSLKSPLLELKGSDRYGCYEFNKIDSMKKKENVKEVTIKGFPLKECAIVFDMKPVAVTNPVPWRVEKPGATSLEIRDMVSSTIHYCVADLQLLQKGTKSYDAENTEYNIMKKYVDENIQSNGYSWDTVNADLTRRITLGLADDSTNTPDSLPYAAWDLASTQKVRYIVVFYGYSLLESRTVAPGTVAASVALTALGLLAGSATGFYTVVYPTGQDRKSVMDACCAIFSVDSNKCLYTSKASLTTFNSNNVEKQIGGLYDKLFADINGFVNGQPER